MKSVTELTLSDEFELQVDPLCVEIAKIIYAIAKENKWNIFNLDQISYNKYPWLIIVHDKTDYRNLGWNPQKSARNVRQISIEEAVNLLQNFPQKEKIKIGDYDVEISDTSDVVKIGCVQITKQTIKQIYERLTPIKVQGNYVKIDIDGEWIHYAGNVGEKSHTISKEIVEKIYKECFPEE